MGEFEIAGAISAIKTINPLVGSVAGDVNQQSSKKESNLTPTITVLPQEVLIQINQISDKYFDY
jgi:hypothetical protein